ncbi:four helix bundle protein [Sinomicrobium sp. M5D2P9]
MTNAEFNEPMRNRTPEYAVRVLGFLEALPKNVSTKVVRYQLAKSSTSVGVNFRAFCRGRSAKECYTKICIVAKGADECPYWMELLKNPA